MLSKSSAYLLLALLLGALPTLTRAQYAINSEHGDLLECDTMSRGIFLFWWDKDEDYSTIANSMLDTMQVLRDVCLNSLDMQDPLGALNGFYCNIYVHTPGSSTDFFAVNFPEWGNGVGGDINGYAFMTLPDFILGDWRNLAHETFHIFQSHGMWDITPGIYNTDDGGWYVEASAEWFANVRYPSDPYSFIQAEILLRTPHVPLWLDFYNLPGYYPNNWQRNVHQYALSTYLYYLTDVVDVPHTDLTSIFYSGTALTPQEYLFNTLGASTLQNHFIDCAARMTNHFDFLLPIQAQNARAEWDWVADPTDDNKLVESYTNTGSEGWFRPEESLQTTAWSFNTYKLSNTLSQTYTFDLKGDAAGTFGDASYFQGKVLVQNSATGSSFHDLTMSSDQQGSLSLDLSPNDTAVYFLIAAMPEYFEDPFSEFQIFPYEMRIIAGSSTAIDEPETGIVRVEAARFNALGQKLETISPGWQIIVYEDGSTETVFLAP